VVKDNKKVHYKARSSPSKLSGMKGSLPGRVEFMQTDPPHRVWSRTAAVLIKEDGQEVRFIAERDQDNHYKVEAGRDLRYLDDRGRVMTEGNMGRVYTFRWGRLFTYVFLNGVLLAVWFAGLWLLLRFQWSHALGLAVVIWGATIVLLIPLLLARVEDNLPKPAAPRVALELRPIGLDRGNGRSYTSGQKQCLAFLLHGITSCSRFGLSFARLR
jgi:hypothetical protein